MNKVASIVIPVYKREELLYLGLKSIHRQSCKYPFEVVVVNDGIHDRTKEICDNFRDKLDIKYFFSGQRNITNPNNYNWRVPGYALNIGVKLSSADIVFLSNAEIYHLDNTIETLTESLLSNNNIMASTCGKDDDGSILQAVRNNSNSLSFSHISHVRDLNFKYPFFLGFMKKHYTNIGGYDEDFSGIGYDDDDFVDRMLKQGLEYKLHDKWIVHLYHGREWFKPENHSRREYNRNLFESKKSIPNNIVRNVNREWGKL